MRGATILTPPSTGFSGILLFSEPNIPEGPEYEKISTLYRCKYVNLIRLVSMSSLVRVHTVCIYDEIHFKCRGIYMSTADVISRHNVRDKMLPW